MNKRREKPEEVVVSAAQHNRYLEAAKNFRGLKRFAGFDAVLTGVCAGFNVENQRTFLIGLCAVSLADAIFASGVEVVYDMRAERPYEGQEDAEAAAQPVPAAPGPEDQTADRMAVSTAFLTSVF